MSLDVATMNGLRGAGDISMSRGRAMGVAALLGMLLGLTYTLSPMSVLFVPIAAGIVWFGGSGLPERERRWVRALLITAITIRVIAIIGLFHFGFQDTANASFKVFFGDEQYAIIRSLRQRSVWLGLPLSADMFLDVYDWYGRTSYLTVIAFVQLLIGPSPYGVHLLNTIFYMTGVLILHRVTRRAYGPVPAFGTLILSLFIPSLVSWSASALKESLHFLTTISTLAAGIAVVRAPWRWKWLPCLALLAGMAFLESYRVGALTTVVLGLVIGLTGRFLLLRPRRAVAALLVLPVLIPVALATPRLSAPFFGKLQETAQVHLGTVFSRGHSYKLLDERFYVGRNLSPLSRDELFRYAGRAALSYVVVPLPWDIRSRSEIAYIPEQILWYVLVLTAAVGLVAGLRRDALVTCVFAGYALTVSATVALASGNVGTLIRHRSLALPYICALSALGAAVMLKRLYASRTQIGPV